MKQELICIEFRNFIAVHFEASIFSKKLEEYDATGQFALWNLSKNDAIIRSVDITPIKCNPLLLNMKTFYDRRHTCLYILFFNGTMHDC